ncbi:hypothetical protein AURDEDRAFT_27379, partial [Auricularia subglabra TFB-10046 SS5]
YPDSQTFDRFRFYNRRENSLDGGAENSMVSVNNNFLVFGLMFDSLQPGRFFAVMEMKATLVYLLMHYDVYNPEKKRPADRWIGESCIPNPTAKFVI